MLLHMEPDRPATTELYAAVDVHYPNSGGAHAAAVLAADARFASVVGERTAYLTEALPYRPGEFYLRELPPLLAVLNPLTGLTLVVVDGYVDLDPDGRPGLGARIYEEVEIPVVGVAKSVFRSATHAVPVLRGKSARPLLVTAAGLPRADAAELVRMMAGRFRVPEAMRKADALARTPPSGAIAPSVSPAFDPSRPL